MKSNFGLFCAAVITLSATKSMAFDCSTAGSQIDKIICASPAVRKADESMSKAYFALLSSTSDGAFRDAIIASQKRWLKNREQQQDQIERDDDFWEVFQTYSKCNRIIDVNGWKKGKEARMLCCLH